MPLISVLRRQKQADLCDARTANTTTRNPVSKKTKTKQKNPIQTNKDLKDLHSNLGRLSFQVTKLMT